jgi:hypothetical protein
MYQEQQEHLEVETMGNAIVDTATFTILATAPVVTVPTPVPVVLTVLSSSNLTALSLAAALKTDMEGQTPIQVGYSTPGFPIPGVLQWDGKLLGSQESTKLTKDGSGVIIDDTPSGTVVFDVITPAQVTNPVPPPPTFFDPATSYPGIWTLVNPGQIAILFGGV